MKNGTLIVEMFKPIDLNGIPGYELEAMEEIGINSSFISILLSSCFTNSDHVRIENRDEGSDEVIVVRITKDNKSFKPEVSLRDDPKNKRFFTLCRIELKLGSELVKNQQLLRDNRLVRVSFIPK